MMDKPTKAKEDTGLKFISERKHNAVLGGGDHDYLPHSQSKCTRHVEAFKKFKVTYKRVYGGYRGVCPLFSSMSIGARITLYRKG